MNDHALMQIAEGQIDWIASKFEGSREAGRLALLSVLMSVRDQAVAPRPEDHPTLLAALKIAVQTIEIWHNLGHRPGVREQVWALYQASPEMRLIADAIAKAEGR